MEISFTYYSGGVLGRPLAPLGAPGRLLGALWRPLGALGSPLGVLWAPLGALWLPVGAPTVGSQPKVKGVKVKTLGPVDVKIIRSKPSILGSKIDQNL